MSQPSVPGPNRAFVFSWSGGKDSCLALHRCVRAGCRPAMLLTMMTEDGERSRSHGFSLAVIQAQAACMGIPLRTVPTSWQDYEQDFVAALKQVAAEGIEDAVFGDLDLEEHRAWEEKVCQQAGFKAHLPLWLGERQELLQEFLDAGFKAQIVAVQAELLGMETLGQNLDMDLALGLQEQGMDLCGEKGEYHSIVTDGPLFSKPLHLQAQGQVEKGGYWVQDLALA